MRDVGGCSPRSLCLVENSPALWSGSWWACVSRVEWGMPVWTRRIFGFARKLMRPRAVLLLWKTVIALRVCERCFGQAGARTPESAVAVGCPSRQQRYH